MTDDQIKSDTAEALQKDLLIAKNAYREVFVKRSPKELWKSTGCMIQACRGFKDGRVLPCPKKHRHLMIFYFMSPFDRVRNWFRMFIGKKIKCHVYHYDPNWESTRAVMYDRGARGMHQPKVAQWIMEASLHPSYAEFLRIAMKGKK